VTTPPRSRDNRDGVVDTAPPTTVPPETTWPVPSSRPPGDLTLYVGVTAGAFCAPPGAQGQTTDYVYVRCSLGDDGKYRWRAT
jgi:hypothetical protein